MSESNKEGIILFCVRCFASSDNSSWGESLIDGHCFNCGAGGATVNLPRWAVESIRQQASWVGKRYYPNQEDYDRSEEINRLRSKMTSFPGREAQLSAADDGSWMVRQKTPGRSWISIFIEDANSAEDALEKTKTKLPYYDEGSLRAIDD